MKGYTIHTGLGHPGGLTQGFALFVMAIWMSRAGVGTGGFASRPQYAVTPDGRFLMNVTTDNAVTSSITIVQNRTAGLKK